MKSFDDLELEQQQFLYAYVYAYNQLFESLPKHTIPHLYPKHHGVLVIALKQPNRVKILSKLNWFLENFASMEIHGRVFQLRDSAWSVYPQLSNPKNNH